MTRRMLHVIEGVASVDESAITGESAPVIRESGGDFSSVTGGTRVLSDWIVVRVTVNPGETFVDRMIATHALTANSDGSFADTPPTTGDYPNLYNGTAIIAPMSLTRWAAGVGFVIIPFGAAAMVGTTYFNQTGLGYNLEYAVASIHLKMKSGPATVAPATSPAAAEQVPNAPALKQPPAK